MININKCLVKYNDRAVLDIDKPLEILRGDKLGVIGANGAGKTTLIKSILGLAKYQGSIRLGISQEDIAVHMQQNSYSNNVDIKTVLEMLLNSSLSNSKTAKELIEYFDFEKCLKKRYKDLSGGEKQKLTMIAVMCVDSPITIFDEVTSGLDFETRQRLMEKLNLYYKDKQTTLIIVSHYYEELDFLCDKLLYLNSGKVKAYGNKRELFNKYCGKTVFVTKNNPDTAELLKGFKRLNSPEHLIALSSDSVETEKRLSGLFAENNIDYKRSGADIEIMTMNV